MWFCKHETHIWKFYGNIVCSNHVATHKKSPPFSHRSMLFFAFWAFRAGLTLFWGWRGQLAGKIARIADHMPVYKTYFALRMTIKPKVIHVYVIRVYLGAKQNLLLSLISFNFYSLTCFPHSKAPIYLTHRKLVCFLIPSPWVTSTVWQLRNHKTYSYKQKQLQVKNYALVDGLPQAGVLDKPTGFDSCTRKIVCQIPLTRVGLKKIFSGTKSSLFFNSFKED